MNRGDHWVEMGHSLSLCYTHCINACITNYVTISNVWNDSNWIYSLRIWSLKILRHFLNQRWSCPLMHISVLSPERVTKFTPEITCQRRHVSFVIRYSYLCVLLTWLYSVLGGGDLCHCKSVLLWLTSNFPGDFSSLGDLMRNTGYKTNHVANISSSN